MQKQFELDPWVVAKEYHLDGGSVEIGIYVVGTPQVMIGVITRPAGGRKWFWHGPDYSKKVFATRAGAIDYARKTALASEAYHALDQELYQWEKQFDYGWENIAANH